VPVEWELRGAVLILIFTGLVERDEIEVALATALSDPRSGLGMGLLWDARRSETPVSTDDLAWRFALVSSLADRGLVHGVALLVTEDWRATRGFFGNFRAESSRMIPRLRAGIFADEAEALAWLGAGRRGLSAARQRGQRVTGELLPNPRVRAGAGAY
jgi:hypothetical protein